MVLTDNIQSNVDIIKSKLNIDKSFDLINRNIIIAGRRTEIFFIDGFVKDSIMEKMMEGFFKIKEEEILKYRDMKEFADSCIPYVEVDISNDVDELIKAVLSGATAMLVDGFKDGVILDLRTYPARETGEPEKEKVTRGSKDGFVETIVFNTALIRRRIRDPKLTFEMISVGRRSQTDVAIGYIEGAADEKLLEEMKRRISNVRVDALTMSQESLIEALVKTKFINPFPKVKYTERPDVAAAQILEGSIVVLVDNSPSIIIMPYSFFDFVQEIEDFYYPPITGCYLRLIRVLVILTTLFLTPTWLLLMKNLDWIPEGFSVLTVSEMNSVPLIVQFLLLEVAIDGLKMASLNTPSALGTSLGIIGGLILGDFAVKSGWFVPDTILYMSIIAVGSFSHPDIELGYAIKFCRIFLLICTWAFNLPGYIIGILIIIFVIAKNKTLGGRGYLYPLIPFNAKELKGTFFRKSLDHNSKEEL